MIFKDTSLWHRWASLIKGVGRDGITAFMPPAKVDSLPNWKALLDSNRPLWNHARRKANKGPAILMATSVGGFSALSMVESVLAVALTLRGVQVHSLLCDRTLPACLRAEKPEVPDPEVFGRYELPKVLCEGCFNTGQFLYGALDLNEHVFSGLLTTDEKERAKHLACQIPFKDIHGYHFENWSIGEHAYAGALRYFASGNLENEPHSDMVVRRYFEGALLTAFVMKRLLQQNAFLAGCFNHGIYSPQGVVGEVCRSSGVRVINWNVAYRKRCFIFSHGDTYHHTLLSEPTTVWESLPWNDDMKRQILSYLKSRWSGTRDWVWFHEKPDEAFDKFALEIGLDLTKPVIGMLTNVMWDAQLHYRANAFPNMFAWVVRTIEYFKQRPDLQLLIRVHPAEIRGTMPSRQPIVTEIKKVFPVLPPNVFIIPPESPVSTYAAMMRCNAVTIYGTKTGVELASVGVPVIVGGEAWIRNKGLTLDASSPEQYVEILNRLPIQAPTDVEQTTRAQKYAYHFFFRRMIPIGFMEPVPSWPPYRVAISTLDELLPGADPGLDVICDGILSGSPFIYPAEKFGIDDR
jgi:hypothetical protein